MIGDTGEDALQSPNLKRLMFRDYFVMLAALLSGDAYVAAGLPGDPVSIDAKGTDKVIRGKVPRKPHRTRTSSPITRRWMTVGASRGSSK
jgi:hypothetical protein